jgi:hypothetical protein
MPAYNIVVPTDKDWLIQAVFFDGLGQLVNSRIIPGNRAIDGLVFRGGFDLIDITLRRKPVHGQVLRLLPRKV